MICNLNYCYRPKIESEPICWVSLMRFFEVAKGHPAFRHRFRR